MRIKSHIPIKVDIGEPEELVLGVKRLTYDEKTELNARWRDAESDLRMSAIEQESKEEARLAVSERYHCNSVRSMKTEGEVILVECNPYGTFAILEDGREIRFIKW